MVVAGPQFTAKQSMNQVAYCEAMPFIQALGYHVIKCQISVVSECGFMMKSQHCPADSGYRLGDVYGVYTLLWLIWYHDAVFMYVYIYIYI